MAEKKLGEFATPNNDYLRTPITQPTIAADDYEIKPHYLSLVQQNQFAFPLFLPRQGLGFYQFGQGLFEHILFLYFALNSMVVYIAIVTIYYTIQIVVLSRTYITYTVHTTSVHNL